MTIKPIAAPIAILLLLAFTGCNKPATTGTRSHLYDLLTAGQILHPERHLVHFHHTCDLILDGQRYLVADIQEIIPGPMTAAGLNRIVVFDPAHNVVQKIEYTLNRPLFCHDNQLYVYGDLRLDNPTAGAETEGNVLTFTDGAKTVALSHIEPQNYPVPATKNRRSYGQ